MNRTPTNERLQGGAAQSPMRYFLLLMAVVYASLGFYLLFAPATALALPLNARRLLGGIFVVYGIFRFVRVYRQHFQKTNERPF